MTLGACSTGKDMATSLPLPDPLAMSAVQPEYRLSPGDLLLFKVFQIDDLERQVRIDQNGHISLPLIGDVNAAGMSVGELEKMVADRYRNGYLQNPQVSVFVQESNGRRVTVTGAVTEPGIYPVVGANLTLQQAVAQAKGVSTVASRGNVIVFRMVNGQKMIARFDLAEIEKGTNPDPEIYGGDIVVVYRSDARVWLRTMLEMTPLVMVWRAYR
ncbi:polysaccharide export protein [Xanthomonas oryzae pv. oryzae]|nr:polysaccharide biosynthesis protein GumB [Xanthomonas oryzae pv. oryzae]AXI23711.1 polysaccharide biosynthesis protein GumB [Xanthomonas oryzae pv. oryzae]AXM11820.1 polysaccharide export protein [Xanthomonas oryzae pv. oryzae]AXM15539.1 polysaccharide export protein [Xanthomonas oryzae pv. oryzae]AXM19289.1 polysaccharide export protein [Xanthomonas oryzae pv. oryzae]